MPKNRQQVVVCKALVTLALAVMLSSSACYQLFRLPDRHLKVLPKREDMIGRWTVDEQSIKRMKSAAPLYSLSRVKPEDHLIVLREDGTCSFKSYWAFQSDRDYMVSEGRWELVMQEPHLGYEGRRASIEITLTPTPNDYIISRFSIVRENDKLVLWQYIGDPDSVKYADFHKVP